MCFYLAHCSINSIFLVKLLNGPAQNRTAVTSILRLSRQGSVLTTGLQDRRDIIYVRNALLQKSHTLVCKCAFLSILKFQTNHTLKGVITNRNFLIK